MDDQIDPRILERFLAGDCTVAERDEVVRWVDGIPERQALISALRMTYSRIGTPASRYDSQAAWTSLSQRLSLNPRVLGEVGRSGAAHHGRRDRGIKRLAPAANWRVAALILAVIGVGSVALAWLRERAVAPRAAVPVAAREVVTPRGQRATVHLADGSSVTLAPASRLRESPDFGQAARDVWLSGEAFFSVVHDPAKPFRVHAPGAVVRDIGTRFLVQSYPQSRGVRVVVAEGSVSLRKDSSPSGRGGASERQTGRDSVVLRSRDLGRLSEDGQLSTVSGVALDDYTAWIDGRLVFTDSPLSEVVPRLSRWYDIELRLGDPALARETFTGTFAHEAPSDVLQLLAATVGARVEKRGDTLILVRRGRR